MMVAKLFANMDAYLMFESKLKKKGVLPTAKGANGLCVIYEDSYYGGNKLYIYESFSTTDEKIGLTPHPSGGTWNDRASSIKVQNGVIWLYNTASWDSDVPFNRSVLVVADLTENNGYAAGYKRLKSVRYPGTRRNWNDVISEGEWK